MVPCYERGTEVNILPVYARVKGVGGPVGAKSTIEGAQSTWNPVTGWSKDWVIVGGESGPHARPMDGAWVEAIRDQCLRASVPFFFKQWGGTNKKKAGRMLDGRVWDQTPVMPEQYGNQKVIRNRN